MISSILVGVITSLIEFKKQPTNLVCLCTKILRAHNLCYKCVRSLESLSRSLSLAFREILKVKDFELLVAQPSFTQSLRRDHFRMPLTFRN